MSEKQFKCVLCRRWHPYCNGHSDGVECISCESKLRRKLISFIKSASWRREDTIITELSNAGTVRYDNGDWDCILERPRVEDWLFEFVRDGVLEWFGAEEGKVGTIRAMSDPLKYRFIPKHKRKKEVWNNLSPAATATVPSTSLTASSARS